uniref:NADH dehydrogenase subunit 4L n=1 Tax=Megalophaedusa kubinaga TaxID=1885702 RepID=A0A224ABB9_9EUPU|nr:NADH dehydrogenase subunit 4L [Megalophaedusa kubinaga]
MFMLTLMLFLLLFLTMLFYSTHRRLMVALLYLESMVLISLMLAIFILWQTEGTLIIFILLLGLAVCEASLALSLLMSSIKITGSDIIKYFP